MFDFVALKLAGDIIRAASPDTKLFALVDYRPLEVRASVPVELN